MLSALNSPTSFLFVHKNQWHLKPFSSVSLKNISSTKSPQFPSGFCTKIAVSAPILNQDSYAVSYLIDSCGLSPENAVSASEKLHFETPERPDSVLTLLRDHGLSNAQISRLVRKRPLLLLSNPEKTLLPKFKFFQSVGLSNTDIARTISKDPTILTRSLENQIKPSYNFLLSILRSPKKVVSATRRTSWIFLDDHTKNLSPNIAILRGLGVPESCIVLLLTNFPEAVMRKSEQFRETVDEVVEMGFNPLKSVFVLAVHALSGGNKLTWDRCYETYKKWGWSEDEILMAFRKHPHCMLLSEKKISRTLDFLVNKMGWQSSVIASCPMAIFFSLERRIIPRSSVIQLLSSKGLLEKDPRLSTILMIKEEYFLDRFVTKFENELPQLLSIYEGKLDALEL